MGKEQRFPAESTSEFLLGSILWTPIWDLPIRFRCSSVQKKVPFFDHVFDVIVISGSGSVEMVELVAQFVLSG